MALPVFLYEGLNWSFLQVGGFLALWIIGYGVAQAFAPRLWRDTDRMPGGGASRFWVFILAAFPVGIAWCLSLGFPADIVLIAGLMLFGVVFAVNSAPHSFLILAYSDAEKVSMNVGFYYMANAGGRLIGTVLSGAVYQSYGLTGCLWWFTVFLLLAGILSLKLPETPAQPRIA